ncbi:MAG: hypothetical protein KF764_15885 [Labilithrix sp.]|nr:hypothetical protein [Labilithrix sp.]
MAAIAGIVIACGAEGPEATAGGGGPSTGDPATCATPNDGCPCDEPGAVVDCGKTLERYNDFVLCAAGKRTCIGERWGECSGDGAISTKHVPSLRFSALQATSTSCGTINACDPYCVVYSDDPSGMTLEGGLAVNDAGIYVASSGDASVPTGVVTTGSGDQGCGATNLHTAPCHTAGVIDHSRCQQDFRCNVATNTCVWNGASGYFDPTAGGVDLTIGAACEYSGTGIVPVCNRGSAAVPAGTSIGINILSAAPADSCAAIGPPTCSAAAPAGGLNPGQCMNLAGCPFTGGDNAAVVNAGQRDIAEGPNRCRNNAASAKNPFAPGCGVCSTCDTRVTGRVYAPNGTTPLAGITVYQAAGPLATFTDGVACDTCASLASPMITAATSAADGSFTLYNASPGPNQQLVVQSGRWRRAVNYTVNACASNAAPAASTRLPQNRTEGSIPKTAFVQGNREALECTLLKFGISPSEVTRRTGPGDAQRIQLYRVNTTTGLSTGMTTSAGMAPSANGLFGSAAVLNEYSVVVLPCSIEMKEQSSAYQSAGNKTNFVNWLNRGGRAFMDHWPGEAFIHNLGPAFSATTTWVSPLPNSALNTMRGRVNATTPAQTLMRDWLANVGGSTDWGAGWMRSDEPWRHALNPNPATTTEWMRGLSNYNAMTGNQWTTTPGGDMTLSYSFETPLAAAPAPACAVGAGGRVIYNGMHVAQARIASSAYPASTHVFPTDCQNGPGLTSEELALMYQFFQLTACALGGEPPPPPPTPPPPLPTGIVFTRDYAASCPSGTRPVWQLFQWQATIPPGTSIGFRAATADTVAGLPPPPPGGVPTTADIGTANATTGGWTNDTDTVDFSLNADTGTRSREYLRVYMTFNTTATQSPVLQSWRQLYDCLPAE